MTATQTVTLASRTFTFTTEGTSSDAPLRILGSLYNSRGKFVGHVTEDRTSGSPIRGLYKHNLPWMSLDSRRAALATLTA